MALSGVPFYKMTGSGNDFVFLDGRTVSMADWPPEAISRVCHRKTGVGADGVVIVQPEAAGAVRMAYFNADGSRAGMCGNAALCSTRLAARLGLAAGEGMDLHTDTGVLKTRCVGPAWGAELLLNDFQAPTPVTLSLSRGERRMAHCVVGVPHLIVLVDDIEVVKVASRGRELRFHSAFGAAGVNVNFVGKRAKGASPEWQLRTYERGVERETDACGTGTVAAAFALSSWGIGDLPAQIGAWGGNVYSVAGRLHGGMAMEPWLCGEGRLVFEGLWFPG